MERRGFSCYDWNIDSMDSVGRPTVSSIKRNIMKDLGKKNYQIILMHDSMNRPLAARALPDLIRTLRKKGYEFDTLDNRKPYLFEW
jgi:peptidoglycan/xylan/chitin deacetylase (PgdA/CDA1 family)